MSQSLITCAYCGKQSPKENGAINRAVRNGVPMYCDKNCMGLARRVPDDRTEAEKKEAKRLYDIEYRARNLERILTGKREYFKRTYDPQKAAVERKAKMPRHVEYCRRPEYREYKKRYDRQYRARTDYGEFADVWLMLDEVQREIRSRATKQEVAEQNDRINKTLRRKREAHGYENSSKRD